MPVRVSPCGFISEGVTVLAMRYWHGKRSVARCPDTLAISDAATLDATGMTPTIPLFVETGILESKFVTMFAMGFPSPQLVGNTTRGIFPACNYFEMGGIHARGIPTEVIDNHPIWDNASRQAIRHAMCRVTTPIQSIRAITQFVFGTIPYPTGRSFFHLRPKAIRMRHADMRMWLIAMLRVVIWLHSSMTLLAPFGIPRLSPLVAIEHIERQHLTAPCAYLSRVLCYTDHISLPKRLITPRLVAQRGALS